MPRVWVVEEGTPRKDRGRGSSLRRLPGLRNAVLQNTVVMHSELSK